MYMHSLHFPLRNIHRYAARHASFSIQSSFAKHRFNSHPHRPSMSLPPMVVTLHRRSRGSSRDHRMERSPLVKYRAHSVEPFPHAVRLAPPVFSGTPSHAIRPFPRITTTIIAPTPLIAANFVILGQIIKRLGQQYSRLSARWCT